MADLRWRRLAVTLACATLLTGCGGAPDKADFVAKMKDSIGTDLLDGMKVQHIDTATGKQLIDDFVTCQYEAIKNDQDLLQKAYDNPGDVNISTQLDIKAAACVQTLSTAMATATGTTTTTTPPPADSSTTLDITTTTIDTLTTIGDPTTTGG